jgi:hypothetical protein
MNLQIIAQALELCANYRLTMPEIASTPAAFENLLREARRWSTRSGIPVVEAMLAADPSELHVHWSDSESRVGEFLALAEKLATPYVVVELDRLLEEDVEESLAVAVGTNAPPSSFAALWSCRDKIGQLCFVRLSFVDPKTRALFHLELQAPWYELIFNTRETLVENASGEDLDGEKNKNDPWGEA